MAKGFVSEQTQLAFPIYAAIHFNEVKKTTPNHYVFGEYELINQDGIIINKNGQPVDLSQDTKEKILQTLAAKLEKQKQTVQPHIK